MGAILIILILIALAIAIGKTVVAIGAILVGAGIITAAIIQGVRDGTLTTKSNEEMKQKRRRK